MCFTMNLIAEVTVIFPSKNSVKFAQYICFRRNMSEISMNEAKTKQGQLS